MRPNYIAIGDIHGRLDLLDRALEIIEKRFPVATTVFLGDYIDRGPDSAGVLDRLIGLPAERFVCLLGNHEDLALENDGFPHYLWDINGGRQTIASYDDDRMSEVHVAWLRELPTMFTDRMGRVYVHAGINPRRELDKQDRADVLWIRDLFLDLNELPAYIVHGHTHTHRNKKTHEVENLPHRCNLDTAAYHTGLLSMAVFDDSQLQPIEIIEVML